MNFLKFEILKNENEKYEGGVGGGAYGLVKIFEFFEIWKFEKWKWEMTSSWSPLRGGAYWLVKYFEFFEIWKFEKWKGEMSFSLLLPDIPWR